MSNADWWDLWRRDRRATPFQSPAWVDAYWRHMGGGERRDAAVRDASGRLAAFLPLTIWQDGPVNRLIPVAAGQSDYSDALMAPDGDTAALWTALLNHSDGCDEVLLPDLRPGSPLLTAPPAGWIAMDEEGEVCPVLSLPEEGTVLAAMSKSRRRKVVHDRNRAEALSGVIDGFADTPAVVDEALDALFRLHAERWAREGQDGVLADPRVQAFLRDAAAGLLEEGLLRLATVRYQGRIVASLLGFVDGPRGHSYINGVDFSVPGQSFGTLAFERLIVAGHESGAREFHFLRGEEAYKYGWGAEPTRTVRRTVRRA
ncbi:GNAT family N-acetyltransferase [Sphingomonas aerophila]|uniref:CelD/BcsL family acetyltransferase involved in cellulose biosynthesis n=1 Tax=Sphingomonas aerophila TaxID=1344948 RepID=A0A7W9EWH6_9SPHN|nr:GNAT family N-acetyltransferase [Sphingomonas aerophila]MBB5715553.1 CelD/BcsL family acetyltransferase involved in cellulose biosynthesis [Sphingomonas aerophila]